MLPDDAQTVPSGHFDHVTFAENIQKGINKGMFSISGKTNLLKFCRNEEAQGKNLTHVLVCTCSRLTNTVFDLAKEQMAKNRNGKGLRRKKGLFNIVEPGEQVESDDGKPPVGEKLKVNWVLLVSFYTCIRIFVRSVKIKYFLFLYRKWKLKQHQML